MTTDLEGRRYVVTGANTGVGRAISEALVARGAHVTLCCRSAERAAAVLEATAGMPGQRRLVRLDLADLSSVREAAEVIGEGPIDALINNAGVGGLRGATVDGFEMAFGVNHLGHFLLTELLLPRLRRVVHVSSGSHRAPERLDFAGLRGPTRSWTGAAEYGVSKLCQLLYHHRLAGRGVPSHAADPGDVASEAYRHVPWPARVWMTRSMKPPSEGAKTPLRCTTEALRPGGFWVDGALSEPSALSQDPGLAAELDAASRAWCGLPAAPPPPPPQSAG